MCGRFAVTTDPARLAAQIDAIDETGTPTGAGTRRANYNVAPSTDIAAVVAADGRRIRLMRWGLEPPWARSDTKSAEKKGKPHPLINARAETAATSPAFRSAAKRRRCLVPMDGYYEWRAPESGHGRKTPFYFSRTDGSPLLVAGLWGSGPDTGPGDMPTCALITTDAVGALATVHHRMPLILGEGDWDRWLDPDEPAPTDLLAAPPDVGGIALREVSTLVNRVANNGPELIAPVGPDDQPVGLF